MRKFLKYLIIILILGGIGAYTFWQLKKKGIIKDNITNAVKKSTDSLYVISYDSSKIDELNGDVSFYNIILQTDSVKKNILKRQDSLPNVLFNIKVKEITATGVDVAGLLKKENFKAEKIIINKPFIQITNTGADKPKPFTYNDTLELYKQIIGRFESIKANAIQIINGTVIIANSEGKSSTTLENINIGLNNFLVDSTRNYQNIVSYFIKDVKVTVENIQLPESKNDTRINIEKFMYDAAARVLNIGSIQQYKTNAIQPITDLKNIQVDDLNTDAFILNRKLRAGMVTCGGGIVTIYKKAKLNRDKSRVIEFSSEMIDEAHINGINLQNIKLLIVNPSKPLQEALVINNVKFTATKVASVTDGSTIGEMITTADWQLSAGDFSVVTKDKLYKVIAKDIIINNFQSLVKINNVFIQPLLSEQAFVKNSRYQRDRFDLNFSNIVLKGVDFKNLLNNSSLEIEAASLQPIMKILNDRTLTPDPRSKVGKYPHQLFLKMPFPVLIKKLQVLNGNIAYKEKAAKSKLTGTVFFSNVNATVSNLTNINEKIKTNPICIVDATALFLGKGKLSTIWKLPLSVGNKNFTVTGNLGQMDATVLNQIIEPLALASIKEGHINKLDFNLNGNDYNSKGEVLFLYNNLNIEVLKIDDDKKLATKDVASFFANVLVKNNNPRRNETYKSEVDYNRDINKSFFNLLWKSIFDGTKKTALGKKN